ncbi:MAG: phosphopyruvate hydratase [Candidatus Dojkabacteria bacterium]|nr:phosphopyruvate hydratase [Candidatus Dojkabacteria bacterium]
MKIKSIKARQIIDSRANPTLEVDMYLEDGSFGRAAVPSGASTGVHEALELRDGDKSDYLGKSVHKAVSNVNETISNKIIGEDFGTQESLDKMLLDLDGTENKSSLGANAILGVSLAFAHAVAASKKLPLFKHIESIYGGTAKMPRPMFNIMNGGKHANWSTDIQEFMVIIENRSYEEQLRAGCEIFLNLEKLLKSKGLATNVGNEGGFAPGFANNEDAISNISEAVDNAGYKLGTDVFFALDVASSEFFDKETEKYTLKTENRVLSKDEWLETLVNWVNKYPIVSLEDGFDEDDWSTWAKFTDRVGDKIQIVGDDLLVTNAKRVKRAIEEKSCNSLLVKVNQIGTLTETFEAMKASEAAGWTNVISHRSGETEDVTISHIAAGTGAGQIKIGAPSRGERTAKFNELLRISEVIY